MERIKILYTGALVVLPFSSVGCNDSEGDLLEPRLYFESNMIKVEVEADAYECESVSQLSIMVKSDISVDYQVGGQDLVDDYNHKHETTGQLLATDNYEMTGTSSIIKTGELYADPYGLSVKNVTKEEDGVTYILLIIVSNMDIEKMSSSSVTYIVARKPIIIDKVYRINPGWLDIRLPTIYKTMGSVTYETLVYAERWKNLGTIMDSKGILIICTGDLSHPDNELRMARSVALQMPDISMFLLDQRYHVAFTYDISIGMSTLYPNGEKIAEKTVGSLTFDLNERFCIGYTYDYDRYCEWNGFVSEVRSWLVARTANQVREDTMFADPGSDDLAGYWELDGEGTEQRGGVQYTLDQSPNHNDATSNNGLRGEAGGSQSLAEPAVIDMRVRLE